ncbi:MAG: hypothetical protein M3R24_13870 [Chloroflexota bacterium]|nr:hypothetical protein [Chloroflexota bacterium]
MAANSLDSVVPNDFPRATYNEIANLVYTAASRGLGSPHLDHFLDAWMAVGYRFCTCAEHDVAFRASMLRAGNNPPRLEHYIQERELYGFFATGLTAIESFYYSCYILGAILDDKSFSLGNPRSITVPATTDKFLKHYPHDLLPATLDEVRKSTEYKEWSDIRNVLAHRILPARQHTVAFHLLQQSSSHDVSWMQGGIPLDLNTTAFRRVWLAKVISELVQAADEFTRAHFPSRA